MFQSNALIGAPPPLSPFPSSTIFGRVGLFSPPEEKKEEEEEGI